ncbi:TRAP transporter substrate-binding protein DctP [Pacificibacter sp. AS14]|uniref:TRAP transporter substrate-binding protein DctP n=1 Tax=Pacificibacter sp. AS14 TaxID=3135785 RepID=UPI003175E2E9
MINFKMMTAAAAVGVLGLTAPALAEIEIRISTAAPGGSPLTVAFEHIAEGMEAAYPDEIDMSVHHSSSLFKQGTEFPALIRGNLEMASPVTFEIEQQLPKYGILGGAYLFRDSQHMIDVFRSDIGEQFYKDVEEKTGVIILDTAYLGTRTFNLTTVHDVSEPADLNGVKMRMPPGPAFQTLASALGATPVSMPITEVYLALKTGAIDGQDNPTSLTRDWKFYEQTKQVILTKHLIQPVFIAITKDTYDKLSVEQQTTLRALTREAVDMEIEGTRADEASAIETFVEAGLTITEVDTELFRKAVWEKYESTGLTDDWMPGLADAIANVE